MWLSSSEALNIKKIDFMHCTLLGKFEYTVIVFNYSLNNLEDYNMLQTRRYIVKENEISCLL